MDNVQEKIRAVSSIKGKGLWRYQSVWKVKKQVHPSFQNGQCQEDSTCNHWHPLECSYCKSKSGCKWGDACVFQAHRQSPRKNCHKFRRDKEIPLCNEWPPYNDVLSTIDTEEIWMATKKQFRVWYCRNAEKQLRTRERERAKDHRKESLQRGPRNYRNPNASSHEDLHRQRSQHCEEQARVEAWVLHTVKTKIRVPRKQRYVF